MTISIGERVETIIRCRASGNLGEYLGCEVNQWGKARVMGMTFEIGACAEIAPFEVKHVETGNVETIEDPFEVPIAVDRLVLRAGATPEVIDAIETLTKAGYVAYQQEGVVHVMDPVFITFGTVFGSARTIKHETRTLRAPGLVGKVQRFLSERS